MNQHVPSSPAPQKPPRSGVTLVLKLLALAAAGSAQATVHDEPWRSVAGFALGGLLFLVAERRTPPLPDPPERDTPPASTGFWTVFAVGIVLCLAAAILVYRGAQPLVTHATWLSGLLCFVCCAVSSWARDHARTRLAPRALAAAALLLLLAGGMFGWHVSTMPPEIHGDEGEIGMDAVELIKQKPFNLFTVGWYWLPRFHVVRQ
ncbi:MAG: hypothetical protein ACRDL7_15670, partial [Gaiellaceae bacterium]